MSNHHRGLWGYHGQTASGRPLTVHATGIGAPSACSVFAELIAAGLRRVVRVGTCRAPVQGPPIGSALLADPVSARDDGVSRALGVEGELFHPNAELAVRLGPATAGSMPLLSGAAVDWAGTGHGRDVGGALLDMQTAGLAAVASGADVAFATITVVAAGDDGRLEDEPLEAVSLRLATAAAAALSQS